MPEGACLPELAVCLDTPLARLKSALDMFFEIPSIKRLDRRVRINPIDAAVLQFRKVKSNDVYFAARKGTNEHYSRVRIPNTSVWRCMYMKPNHEIYLWVASSPEEADESANNLSRQFWYKTGKEWVEKLGHNTAPNLRARESREDQEETDCQ